MKGRRAAERTGCVQWTRREQPGARRLGREPGARGGRELVTEGSMSAGGVSWPGIPFVG